MYTAPTSTLPNRIDETIGDAKIDNNAPELCWFNLLLLMLVPVAMMECAKYKSCIINKNNPQESRPSSCSKTCQKDPHSSSLGNSMASL
eukprot:CAMPEP_0178747330 /NCGR_PEP_ID=MMETSP0744-20121128/8263_1 /TAXON_ID=913974 /ORGANISM="Nitzschia punctata, Strain CCMP561" /LENGTH=88 /DNA_ID=CAMNT_0020400557 /DNA_START=136 /DNA_END=402 /DNA_ORIENTATION=+